MGENTNSISTKKSNSAFNNEENTETIEATSCGWVQSFFQPTPNDGADTKTSFTSLSESFTNITKGDDAEEEGNDVDVKEIEKEVKKESERARNKIDLFNINTEECESDTAAELNPQSKPDQFNLSFSFEEKGTDDDNVIKELDEDSEPKFVDTLDLPIIEEEGTEDLENDSPRKSLVSPKRS